MRASLAVAPCALDTNKKTSRIIGAMRVLDISRNNTDSTPCSKSLSETNLKIEVVSTSTQSSGGGLFVLRNKRQPIRNSILERENLVGIGGDVGRVSDGHFLADSSSKRQARGRSRSGRAAANHRVDLETRQAE